MENIYHYEITAILEEMCRQTVTNFRQGLNVPPFDPKGRSMKQLDMDPVSFCPDCARETCEGKGRFLTLNIPDKW